MQWVMRSWAILRRVGVQVGPYVMIEILLPGGSLMALLLFLYRRRRAQGASGAMHTMLASANGR
jgi:hypothetical protein